MAETEWVGGRIAAPLFVEDRGGFQADLILWMDVTRDLVVGMEVVHPDDPDSKVAAVFEQALRKPMAGPKRPPDRVRVAHSGLADVVAPLIAGTHVNIAPTPEVEQFVAFMGASMPGAAPHLAAFRRLLLAEPSIVRPLLAAAADLFRARPWSELSDSDVLQLEIPNLGVEGWCVSIMGKAKQSWGIVLFQSAVDYKSLFRLVNSKEDLTPADLGVEALSLSFSGVGELPTILRRDLTELGWDLVNLDVFPIWFRALPGGKPRSTDLREFRILASAASAIAEHVTRHRDELGDQEVPQRTIDHQVEIAGTIHHVRTTTPHPEVPWKRSPDSKPRTPSRARPKRSRKQ
jgi:hypothetical protein